MSLTDRDRKVLLGLLAVLLVVGYWFLMLSPKRDEAAQAQKEVTKQVERRDAARATATQGSAAKATFASDYTAVVRLGKAVPSAVDMPGLIVQLARASKGTGINFTKVATGQREGLTTPTPPAASGGSGEAPPAAAGGQPAQSAPGSAAESANNASATSDQRNQTAPQSGVGSGDTQPGAAAGTAPAALETVPLDLEFEGNFFNLAGFFHRVKRLVKVANERVVVSGRLVTIEGVKYSSDPEIFPKLRAEIKATVYLVPQAQGTAAGATPQGPSQSTPAAPGAPAATPPAATGTPR